MEETLKRLLAAFTGYGFGSTSDGLQHMMRTQMSRVNSMYPASISQSEIMRHAEAAVDVMNINPYSGFGQGLARNIASAYNFAPNVIGAFIGAPGPGTFFQQIANGAGAISEAAGMGRYNMFNPYSVMDAHRNAVGIANSIYEMATRGGGYNVEFTQGLNMSEVGRVSQRILSSSIPYMDERGNRLGNGDEDRQKFKQNLERLGKSINGVVSTVTKITGDLDEAISFLDRIGGGNFLSGTETQAMDVARKARGIASAIRITSAAAGVSPIETFRNMMDTQNSVLGIYGVNPEIAAATASGMDNSARHAGFMSTMAYNSWLAGNQGASPTSRRAAMLGAMSRVRDYAGSSGARLAAIVSANMNLFDDSKRASILRAFESGNPNAVLGMVREALGNDVFAEMMNDDSYVAYAREMGDKDFQEKAMEAGVKGNLLEAVNAGARRAMNMTMRRIDSAATKATGVTTFRSSQRSEASLRKLREMAGELGWNDTENASAEELREFLNAQGKDMIAVRDAESLAEIQSQTDFIFENRMTEEEEKKARLSWLSEIERMNKNGLIGGKDYERFKTAVESGKITGALRDDFISRYGKGREKELLDKITGGARKFFRGEAEDLFVQAYDERKRFTGPTDEEKEAARKSIIAQRALEQNVSVLNMMSGNDFKENESDYGALEAYAENIKKTTGVEVSVQDALKSVVRNALGSKIGNVSALDEKGNENPEYNKIVDLMSGRMYGMVRKGVSAREAFSEVIGDADVAGMIGDQKTVDKLKRLSSTENSAFSRENLTRGKVGAAMASAANSRYRSSGNIQVDESEVEKAARYKRSNGEEMLVGGDASNAMLNRVKAVAEKMGVSFDQLYGDLMKGGDFLGELDKAEAMTRQNALKNAIQAGGGSFAMEAIEESKSRMERIREAIIGRGKDKGFLEKFLSGDESAEKEMKDIVGVNEFDYDKGFIKSLAKVEFTKDGKKVTGLELLANKDMSTESVKDKGNNEAWANVTRLAGKEEGIYGPLEMISKAMDSINDFINNPMAKLAKATFNVKITESETTLPVEGR